MKRQRPATAGSVQDGLKLHRHPVRSPGAALTVITPRPGTRARFSTNRYHETWHVLSDDHGARLLARLLWGLSYQARPGTLVVIDRAFLTPNPFDAEPAAPIVLAPGWCTPVDDRTARHLKHRLPLRNPEGTVRWRTFGLNRTLEPEVADRWWADYRHHTETGPITLRSGLLVLAPATPRECRAWALGAARLDTTRRIGTDHVYLRPDDRGYDGEIQIFRRFHPMVNVARQARTRVLARADIPADPDDLRSEIWRESRHVRSDAHLRIRIWRNDAHHLGDEAAAKLAHAGLTALDDLAATGPVEAYRRMRAARVPGLDLDMLWAMEAALTFADRRTIGLERRRELLAELGDEPTPRRRRYRAPIHRRAHRTGRPTP